MTVAPRDIVAWSQYLQEFQIPAAPSTAAAPHYEINQRVALWQGNITRLDVDAVQNAANTSLLGGGGIDGAIHSAAGPQLVAETRTLGGCPTGQTKITKGYRLPARHVLHTVGPIGENPTMLESCYRTTLDLAWENKLKTIALCGVSTGIYGYPRDKAAEVACATVRAWLEEKDHWKEIEKIIFVVFLEAEKSTYENVLPRHFPAALPPKNKSSKQASVSQQSTNPKRRQTGSKHKPNKQHGNWLCAQFFKF